MHHSVWVELSFIASILLFDVFPVGITTGRTSLILWTILQAKDWVNLPVVMSPQMASKGML